MLYIYSQEQLEIPENVKIHIRSRVVTVEGPRGKPFFFLITYSNRAHKTALLAIDVATKLSWNVFG